jgi:hypothetical protein
MRLRASITVDIEAADYVEAAAHQRRLQALFDAVAAAYPGAGFEFRERRARLRSHPAEAASETVTQLKHYTGKLSRYS